MFLRINTVFICYRCKRLIGISFHLSQINLRTTPSDMLDIGIPKTMGVYNYNLEGRVGLGLSNCKLQVGVL